MTDVIFREREGEIVALFPELPCDINPRHCKSYIKGKGWATGKPEGNMNDRLATLAEYLPLKAELEEMGYELEVMSSIHAKHLMSRTNMIHNEKLKKSGNYIETIHDGLRTLTARVERRQTKETDPEHYTDMALLTVVNQNFTNLLVTLGEEQGKGR